MQPEKEEIRERGRKDEKEMIWEETKKSEIGLCEKLIFRMVYTFLMLFTWKKNWNEIISKWQMRTINYQHFQQSEHHPECLQVICMPYGKHAPLGTIIWLFIE